MADVTEKKTKPTAIAIAFALGAGGGAAGDKLVHDSPVHFAVQGEAPPAHDGWKCEPEGGIIGAPMVCRLTTQAEQPAPETTTLAK